MLVGCTTFLTLLLITRSLSLSSTAYIDIPLKWHKKFARLEEAPIEVDRQLDETIKRLILKKRVTRVIPRHNGHLNGGSKSESSHHQDNEDDHNDIEIKQQLWIITLYK